MATSRIYLYKSVEVDGQSPHQLFTGARAHQQIYPANKNVVLLLLLLVLYQEYIMMKEKTSWKFYIN